MCSIGSDFENEGEKQMPKITKFNLKETKCNKCREEKPVILLRKKDAYCKNCFLTSTNHKFKALLGKSRLIRPSDRILVSYEVGHPSTALLHLLRDGLDLNTPKRLRFEPVIVFIEDHYHLSVQERNEMVEKVLKQVELFKFKVQFVSLVDSIINGVNFVENIFSIGENDREKLNKIIAKETSKTKWKEILNILKRNILISIGKKLNCKFIFTPELSIDIASNLLTNISLGKGSQVPVDTGFCDDRDTEIKLLRPLRSFDMKELAFYNFLNSLEPIYVRNFEPNPYSSVQNLIKKFVSDLQENYPATVTTIVKTGDKLAAGTGKVSGKCRLCKGIILNKTGDLDSEEATNFSRLVSGELPDRGTSSQERYARITEKFSNYANVDKEYCFSCSKISEYLLEET